MNEAWKEYIQPILDSGQFTWVWDPFLENYSNFSVEQQTQIENALAITAFDTDDEELAIKALGIADTLCTSHLASQRLSELIKNGLREQVHTLKIDSAITYYYIVAFSFFGITEAIPFIKLISEQLEKVKTNNNFDKISGNTHSHQQWSQACSAALLRLEPYYTSQDRQNSEQAFKNLKRNSSER